MGGVVEFSETAKSPGGVFSEAYNYSISCVQEAFADSEFSGTSGIVTNDAWVYAVPSSLCDGWECHLRCYCLPSAGAIDRLVAASLGRGNACQMSSARLSRFYQPADWQR